MITLPDMFEVGIHLSRRDDGRDLLLAVEHFFCSCPPFLLASRFQRDLARIAKLPPLLRFGIGSHFGHVGFEVDPCVFKVRKKEAISMIDGIIVNIAFVYHLEHSRPDGGMEALVLLQLFWADAYDLPEADHG